MDRGAWWATVYGVAKSQTRLRDWTELIYIIYNYQTYWLLLLCENKCRELSWSRAKGRLSSTQQHTNGPQPSRAWGKNTWQLYSNYQNCHFYLYYIPLHPGSSGYYIVVVKLLSHVWLFCAPMDWIPPSFSVHGIFQARILEWVAISFSRGSSWPGDWTWVSFIAGRFFTTEPPRKALRLIYKCINYFFAMQVRCFSNMLGLLGRDCNRISFSLAWEKEVAFLTMSYIFEWCCWWRFLVCRERRSNELRETVVFRTWNPGLTVR